MRALAVAVGIAAAIAVPSTAAAAETTCKPVPALGGYCRQDVPTLGYDHGFDFYLRHLRVPAGATEDFRAGYTDAKRTTARRDQH